MTTKEKNKLVRDTLREVNKIRKVTGRKPLKKMPKGVIGKAESCPIATALNHKYRASVEGDVFTLTGLNKSQILRVAKVVGDTDFEDFDDENYSHWRGTIYFAAPKSFDDFVTEFDNREIPELIYEAR